MDWLDELKTFAYYAGAAMLGIATYDKVVKPSVSYVTQKVGEALDNADESTDAQHRRAA